MDPLKEIVGIILSGGQRVELHLHTEWADESTVPLLPGHAGKRQHLRHFSEQEQRILIDTGMSLLTSAGGGTPKAFRAGSFGFNRDTLSALSHCGIQVDSSYNAATMGPSSGVADGILLLDTVRLGNISEYPLSVVRDGIGRIRQVSLTACSASELEDAMWSALEGRYRTFVLLFHNFDLLNQRKDHADPITVERLRRLCKFLAANRDSFRVTDFSELPENADYHQPDPLPVSRLATARRIGEQFLRRLAR
ncbi:MAG: polysaccharide deacetylase [Betaproteobacteria bacterium]|nr:polysaccharide deacetylase [Betaproteobacteria bacterium]